MGQTFKVAEEVAASEFSRMCDLFRVDQDTSKLDEKELASWNDTRGAVIRDIRVGLLVIDPEGRPIYTPPGGKSIKFNPPTGATMMALETYGKDKQISNTVAAMGDMTETNKGEFSRLAAPDFRACMRLTNLFLSGE